MNSSCGADICSFSALRGSSSSEYEAGLAVKSSFSFLQYSANFWDRSLRRLLGRSLSDAVPCDITFANNANYGSRRTNEQLVRGAAGSPRRLGPGGWIALNNPFDPEQHLAGRPVALRFADDATLYVLKFELRKTRKTDAFGKKNPSIANRRDSRANRCAMRDAC